MQYDCPGTVKDYVHRVGRTARAGKTGKSLLLLSAHEASYVDVLREQKINIKQVKYEKCLEKLRNVRKLFICFTRGLEIFRNNCNHFLLLHLLSVLMQIYSISEISNPSYLLTFFSLVVRFESLKKNHISVHQNEED